MSQTLIIVFPVFALIGLGFFGARSGLIGERTGEGLADFVFTFAVPALLFRTIATASAGSADPWRYWAAYFIGVALVWLLATLSADKLFGLSKPESAIAGFSTGQANTVLMGLPLIMRSFGDAASVPLFMLLAIHLPVTMTAATLLVERNLGGNPRARDIARKLYTNPILIGIGLGVLVRATGLPMPDPVMGTVRLLGDAASPCALFTLGIALKRYGLGTDIRLLGVLSALKLVVHPACVYIIGRYVFDLPALWVGVGVLFASCPSGINAYLLAERYKIGVAMSSGTIMVSSTLSLLTTTFWVWLVTG